jgi:hypothetical protein
LDHFSQVGRGDYNYFKGSHTFQRGFGIRQQGAGLGNVLKSLWRTFLPILKSTGEVVGKEALSTGSRILGKVAEGENVKQVLRQESLKGLDNVLERGGMTRQHGKGIKGIRKRAKTTSPIKNYIGKKVKLSVPIKRKRSDAFGFY